MCPEYDGYDGVHISLWPGIMIKGHLHEWPVRVVSCISVVSHLHHHTPHIINTSWCDMNQGKENSDISKSIRVRLLDEQNLEFVNIALLSSIYHYQQITVLSVNISWWWSIVSFWSVTSAQLSSMTMMRPAHSYKELRDYIQDYHCSTTLHDDAG